MRKLRILLLAVVGCILGVPASAEDAVLQKIASLNKAHSSIQYNFQEHDFKKLKNTTRTLKGTLYFNGKQLAMIYTTPAGDRKVISGNAYSQCKDGKSMKMSIASKNPITSLSHMLLWSLAGNVQSILTENGAKAATSTVGNQLVVVITKDKGAMGTLKKLTLKYNKTSGVLEYMKMEQATGDYNEYVISGTATLNKPIAAERFTHAK